jgi:hypothetical protein
MTCCGPAPFWINHGSPCARIAAALAVVLDRWEAREPGAEVNTAMGLVVIAGYSPCFRRVYFRWWAYPSAPSTAAWRTDFNRKEPTA